MVKDIHQEMIAEREAKVEKLKSQIDALNLEIKVLREAQALVQNGKPVRVKGMRDRPLKPEWNEVLIYMGKNGQASLDGMKQHPSIIALGINDDTLRGQMSTYKSRGWIEPISPGVFRLTESGAAKCGYAGKEEAPEVGASDEVDASSKHSGATQTDKQTVDPLS